MNLAPVFAAALLALNAAAAETAAPPKSAPVISIVLDASRFRGADPQATCARVDAFVARLGRTMKKCQDNDARIFVTVRPRFEDESGPLAAIRGAFARMRFEKSLKDARLGEVRRDGDVWHIPLRPPLYEDGVRRALAAAPAPFDLVFYVNKGMDGTIWADLSIDGLSDAKAYAARLSREHPEIREAGVYVMVEVFQAHLGR